MPAIVTHLLNAENTLKLKGLPHFDNFCKDAFLLGSQGGDFLYFYKPLSKDKRLYEVGTTLHTTKTFEFFSALLQYLKEEENPIFKSYIYGYINHYSLDTLIHPYVYFFQDRCEKSAKKRRKNDNFHAYIEADLDSFLINNIIRKKVNKYKFYKKLLIDQQKINTLSTALEKIINKVYGCNITCAEIVDAFNDFYKFNKILYDRFYIKRKLIALFEKRRNFSLMFRRKKYDKNIINLNKKAWFNLLQPEKIFNDDFLCLFTKGPAMTLKLITEFENALKNSENLNYNNFGRSFDNGLILQ